MIVSGVVLAPGALSVALVGGAIVLFALLAADAAGPTVTDGGFDLS